MKEAQPIADAGSLNIEASQATRRSAADGGESVRDAAAEPVNGQPADAGRDSVSPESAAQLAPDDADRFAMAFRPSWEPVAPTHMDTAPSVKFRSFAPSLAPVVPHVVNDAGGFLQDDLLRLRAARVRSRSLALAAVSILSFGALMYWGISSTTDGAARSATRGLQTPPAAVEPAEEEVAPAAAAAEPPKLSARLADPNAPTAAEAVANEARETPAQSGEAGQPSATAAAEPSAPAAAQEVKPLAASPANPVSPINPANPANPVNKPPATITDVKPATAAVEAPPAPVVAVAKPASTAALAPSDVLKPETTQAEDAAKASPPLLVVRAVPDSAQLFLDGQSMPNPFDTRLPLGSKHKIDARQDGYETSSQSIRLESDAKLTITLKRATPAPEPHLKVRSLPESANGAGFVTSNPY